MTTPQLHLPGTASLEHLRKQAKRLQRRARAADPEATALVDRHFPDAPADLPLSAAQTALARAYGFPSWPALVDHLDVVRRHLWLPAEAPADEPPARRFARLACLDYTDDAPGRRAEAERVLADDPTLTADDPWAAAAASDTASLRRMLAADPGIARRAGGPYGWTPLFHLAYSRVGADRDDVVAAATALLDAGADPAEGYLWHGETTPFTLLTGCFGEGEGGPRNQPRHPHSAALARLLLVRGADANDGQTLYNRMFGRDDDHLVLLFDHGLGEGDGGVWRRRLGHRALSPAQMLADVLRWAVLHGQAERVRLLLEHGVDPDLPSFRGGAPYDLAVRSGEMAIADLLTEYGAKGGPVGEDDRLLGALLAGDTTAAAVDAGRLDRLRARHPGLVVRAAALHRPGAVRLLAAHGWSVDALGNGDGPDGPPRQTALQAAAFDDDVDVVRTLLDLGADPAVRDPHHGGTALGWARHAGSERVAAVLEPVSPTEN